MGKTFSTGLLTNGIWQDSSNNIGIGAAANASFKLQVTGATNLTGALSGTSGTFSGNVTSESLNITSASTSPVGLTITGADETFVKFIGPAGVKNWGFITTNLGASDFGIYQSNSAGGDPFSAGSPKLYFNGDGNVGIGTTTPTGTYGKLSVAGGISILNDNNAKLEIGRYSSGAPNSYIKIGASSNSLRITNAADTIDLVSFFNSGFTFFGTIPSVTNYIKYNFNVGTDQNIGFRSSSSIARLEATNDAVNANVPMEFAASTFIFTGGNVGIGTSSPSFILDVNDTNASGVRGLRISSSSSSVGPGLFLYLNSGTATNWAIGNSYFVGSALEFISSNSVGGNPGSAGTARMLITNTGNVLIGTTSNNGQGLLRVNGNVTVGNESLFNPAVIVFNNAQNAYRFGVNGSCTQWEFTNGAPTLVATVNGASGVYTALSDVNKKKDFEESTIGLNAILNLKPTLYRMITDDESVEKTLGLIAQEVKEFIPQAYVESGEGEDVFIGLQDRPIIAALVKAVQEQQAQIEELRQIVATK